LTFDRINFDPANHPGLMPGWFFFSPAIYFFVVSNFFTYLQSTLNGSFISHAMKKFLFFIIIFFSVSILASADYWTAKTNFPGTGTQAPFAFVIGSKGYVGCGGGTAELWEFDPATNAWTQMATFGGVVRMYAQAFAVFNKGYVCGGRNVATALSDCWEYDPSLNAWTQITNFPTTREGGISFASSTKGYMGTGHIDPSNSIAYDDLWEYDPALNSWTQKANFPAGPRVWSVGFSINDKCYLHGGCDGFTVLYSDFYEYDPALNVWTAKASFPGTPSFDAAAFSICGRGYVGTGESNLGFLSEWWQYDPVADQWLQKANFPGGIREETAFFSIADHGYVGMGNGSGNINDLWEYTPDTNTCMVIAAFSAPHHVCPGTCTDFLNLSANANSFLWNFPGANPSSSIDVNPSNICYNTPGNYSVTLIASNSNNTDTITLNNYVTVYPYPPPQGISQSGDTLFANAGSVMYQWYFNGTLISGATDYFYLATASGDYNVVATDLNGCEVEAVVFNVFAQIGSAGRLQPMMVYLVDGTLMIRSNYSGDQTLSIYNVLGKNIFSAGFHDASAIIPLPEFVPGIYIAEISGGDKIFRTEFVRM
jgi:N-acetylneuraminic acid mutarotase